VIVVAGEALVDLVINQAGEVVAKLGGGPFNVARTIARLGSPAAFCGTLSHDRFGVLLRQRLVADGVDESMLQFSELPTTLAAAELDRYGAATYRFYIRDTAAPAVETVTLPANLSTLHVGTLGFVLEPMASTLEACVMSVAPDVTVVIDPNCRSRIIDDRPGYLRRLERVFERADVVKVSTDDLEYMDPDRSASDAALALLHQGPRVVLHTDGGRATHVHTHDGSFSVPVPTVDVADTIGAGDSFGGAFVAWWHQAGLGRADLHDQHLVRAAVAAAVNVAGITCTRQGAEPPTAAELGTDWQPSRR
jgi:fructokinase